MTRDRKEGELSYNLTKLIYLLTFGFVDELSYFLT